MDEHEMRMRQVFGGLLRVRRRKAGWSAAQVAAALGLSKEAILHWEQGRGWPGAGALCQLLALFGASILPKVPAPGVEAARPRGRPKKREGT